ncbi:sugar phosphate isomerase/epimerase [Natronoglomus mannanivorans]|uniref:TIM barrel protein n=1 Tax=Natronoglomus mannanivorans TaxID=2979990 RepID=A0AAP2Z0P1_9EURY|nr:TIM barrel protein [Halobacteria archaeon AArc-xg1-1]
MIRTAIQLQTFRSLPETLPETISRVGTTALEGVELPALNGTPPADVADALEETDLDVVAAHVSLEELETEYETVLEAYETIDCSRLVVKRDGDGAFDSVDDVDATAQRLSTLASRLADDGFELLYHNGTAEFASLEGGSDGEFDVESGSELELEPEPEPETAYDAFVTATDEAVGFELDTGLATYAGVDPSVVLARHPGRIPVVHLTDAVAGGEATRRVELGAGELAVENCVETAREAGVEWLVYEHVRTSDPLDSLTHAATKLPMLSERSLSDSHPDPASTD